MGTVSSQTESPEGAVASVVALAPQPAAGTVALAPQPAAGTVALAPQPAAGTVALAPQPAAGTVALAPQPAAGTAAGWQLPHVRQRHSWDCGLACVEMVLRARGVAVDAAALAAEVGTRSTWTADLAHLLARRVPGVVYWTTFAGVRTSHAGLAFYGSRGLREDAPRVARLLGAAPSVGLRVVEESMPLAALRRGCEDRSAVFVVLVDGRLLRPAGSRLTMSWLLPTFLGHYIVLCGYDAAAATFQFRDPGVALASSHVHEAVLETARKARGTDEDVIVVSMA